MSSLGSVLNNARSAMTAPQTAVQIAWRDISDPETEGNHRQRIDLATNFPQRMQIGC